MRMHRGPRFVLSWLAALAMLLATLAPSISQALAASSGRGWLEVCSASNVQVAPTRDGRSHDPAGSHAFEHCPYCALHADVAPPPAPAGLAMVAATSFLERPAAFLNGPRGQWAWSAAQPRAPPAAA